MLLVLLLAGCRSEEPPPEAHHEPPGPIVENQMAAPPLFDPWVRYENHPEQMHEAMRRFYVDLVLGHRVFRIPPRGLPQPLARALLLDDDELLLSSGPALWNRELKHRPGLIGRFCYIHSTYCLETLFQVSFSLDGTPLVIYDNQYGIERFPSHTHVQYALPSVRIDENKLITDDDRAVLLYTASSNDGRAHELTIDVIVPHPPVPNPQSDPGYPVLARGHWQGKPLALSIEAPGFEPLTTSPVHLRRTIRLGEKQASAPVSLAYVFRRGEDGGEANAAPLSLTQHMTDYNRWFAENIPYFDSSEPGFEKMWLYRWWIVRFHQVEVDTPDLDDVAFYEGKLGFDNVIGFAVPAQLKELSYLRDPRFAWSQARNSYRNRAENGAVVDPPGSPYWNETYSHWNAQALAELNRVHPRPADELRRLLPGVAADVRAWAESYDRDGDALPERQRPRVTGYDLDILSWWFFNDMRITHTEEPPALERVDFASFVYANAMGAAELAAAAGDESLRKEMAAVAERIRDAALQAFWDEESGFFHPRTAGDDQRIPVRELHGLFPFTTGLAPNREPWVRALEKLVDPKEFWARFPPVITSQAHYRKWGWEMDGLTRNIAPHPISMGARTVLKAIKHYDGHPVTAQHFMELMRRYNDLVYPGVHPGDPLWRPNVHEYYSKWEPYSISPQPKPSDISHDFHSMYLSLVVEGAVGLTPRIDDRIELQPLAREWDFFLLDRLRYRNHDLTVVWDRPGDVKRYEAFPEGFSLYVDGEQAFTRPELGHVIWDPATGAVEEKSGRQKSEDRS